MKPLRYLCVLLALMSCSTQSQPRLIVIGDSLSTTSTSWPVHIEGYTLHLLAQNGRTIRDYSPPRDLRKTNPRDRIVYALGGNDIGSQSVHDGDPKPARVLMLDHLRFLSGRGFRVLVVVPPMFNIAGLNRSNRRHRTMILNLRGVVANVEFYDLNKIWDKDMTIDGLHPGPELSYLIAMEIQARLK